MTAKMFSCDAFLLPGRPMSGFAPALCAAVQVSLGVKLLTGRPVQTGTLHCFDLLHDEYETIVLR